jgi:hypothetical protein
MRCLTRGVQTLKAKEGGSSSDKPRGEKPAAAAASATVVAAAQQQMPKENISFGNVSVDGKGLNDSKHKDKKVICHEIAVVMCVLQPPPPPPPPLLLLLLLIRLPSGQG